MERDIGRMKERCTNWRDCDEKDRRIYIEREKGEMEEEYRKQRKEGRFCRRDERDL